MDFSAEECFLEKHYFEASEKQDFPLERMGTNAVVNINVSMRGLPRNISRRDLLAIISKVALESGASVAIEVTEGQDYGVHSLPAASLAVGGDGAIKNYLNGVKEYEEGDETYVGDVESSDDDELDPVLVDVSSQDGGSSDAFSIIDSEQEEDPINGEHYIDSDFADGPITDTSDSEEVPEELQGSLQEMRERWGIPPPPNGNNHVETDSEEDYYECDSDSNDGGELFQRTVLNQIRM